MLEQIKALAEKIAKDKANIKNEAQTRTGFVNPFLKALDYKLDDISIILPEYDVGDNKDKKVDYAILRNKKPLVLIEIKHCEEDLNKHTNQLKNYFALCADCSFAILTNGLEYRFFSNTEKLRTMDREPFMVLNLESTPLDSSLTSEKLAILELFSQAKLSSNVATIRNKARAMLEKNTQNSLCADIKARLIKETKNPSKELVDFIMKPIIKDKDKDKQRIVVNENYKNFIVRAFNEIIADKVNEIITQNAESQGDSKELSEDGIGAFHIVRGILMENPKANLQNIVPRPTTNYLGIFLDDKSTKWICQLWLNGASKYIKTPKEARLNIANLSEIYKYKNELLESLKMRLK